MKEVFDSLRTQIATSNLIKHVDEDWGQLDMMPNPPVKFPCALISISSGRFTDVGMDRTQTPMNRQQGVFTVTIRVATKKLSNSSALAPVGQKNNSMAIFDAIQEVHSLIHGWYPNATSHVGKFMRESIQNENRDDGIQEYVVSYSVGVSDI